MTKRLRYLLDLPKCDYLQFTNKLIETRSNIGILRGACYGLPNPELLLSPSIMREALESSEIENIVTTLADVLQAQLFTEPEQSNNDKEVLRYNRALSAGLNDMQKRYLGVNTIRTVHSVLIPNEPDFRKTQNALVNDKTGEVVYVPVAPQIMYNYLSDLEKYLNQKDDTDPIIKIILAHYQFEAIHPFGDGNGRTGRILMVLSLIHFNLLEWPVLFISEYINNHKNQYYKTLRAVDESGDFNKFINYMLNAFNEQAKKSTETLLKINSMYDEVRRSMKEKLPKIYSRDLVDVIFSQPLITATRYGKMMSVSYPTALAHLRHLEEAGFMQSAEVGRYNVFANIKLMQFLNGSH